MFLTVLIVFFSLVQGGAASNRNQQPDGFFITAEGIRVATCTKAAASLINNWCDQGAFLLSDFDGVIGAGTGWDDKTPPRFVSDVWQARCPHLLQVFQDQYFAGRALILSAGTTFLDERPHYGLQVVAGLEPLSPDDNKELFFYPGVGFYVRHTDNNASSKGKHIALIADCVRAEYDHNHGFVFVDDMWMHVVAVSQACQEAGINIRCIWLPHQELHPEYWHQQNQQQKPSQPLFE